MKSLNNRVHRAPAGHLLSLNEASSTGNELCLIKFLDKGVPRNLQITQAIVKTISCSPQSDGKDLLLKTTPVQPLEQREVKLLPT